MWNFDHRCSLSPPLTVKDPFMNWLHRKRLRVLVLCLTLCSAAQTSAAVTSKNLGSIWYIGDSITQSNADGDANGSPRLSLYNALTNAGGYTFNFTGHYTSDSGGLLVTGGTAATNLYQYHSGISGSVIGSDISGRVGMTQNMTAGQNFWNTGRLAVSKPNSILIMLGTNDINSNIDIANAPNRMTTLLNTIFALPGVGNPTVMVATIPPNRIDSVKIQNVLDFNSALPGVISLQQGLNRDVYLVDQFTPLNNIYSTVMRPDNLHPNAAGNTVIGQTWLNAIGPVAVPEPSTYVLLGGILAILGWRGRGKKCRAPGLTKGS
jgi:hypothetical protein